MELQWKKWTSVARMEEVVMSVGRTHEDRIGEGRMNESKISDGRMAARIGWTGIEGTGNLNLNSS